MHFKNENLEAHWAKRKAEIDQLIADRKNARTSGPVLLKAVVESTRFIEIESEAEIDRLRDEMIAIVGYGSTNLVNLIHQLSLFCKSKSEPLFLCGSLASLYTLYLLGVAKFDPIETGARFETLLGTIEQPKRFHVVEFRVRPGFEEELKGFCAKSAKGYRPYIQVDDKGTPILHGVHFLDETIDLSDEVETREGIQYDVFRKGWAHMHEGFEINILPWDVLQDVKETLCKMGPLNIERSLPVLRRRLADGDYTVIGKKPKATLSSFDVPNMGLGDLVSLISNSHNSLVREMDVAPFYDRDSLLAYLLSMGLGIETAYYLMELTRKGLAARRGNRLLRSLPSEVAEKLRNFRYLSPRGHAAEEAWVCLILVTATVIDGTSDFND